MKSAAFLLLLSLILSPLAFAKDKPAVKVSLVDFAAQKTQVLQDFEEGKRYSELTATQRREVMETLDRMERTLSGVASLNELREDVKASLINDQEKVNTVLTQAAEDSRLVCKRERRVGSHRVTTTCRTVGEIRRAREQAQRDLGRKSRVARLPGE